VRIVLDTNVLISGIFFTGPPHRILETWKQGGLALLLSTPILDEYRRVGHELAKQYRGIDLAPLFNVLTTEAEFVREITLTQQVCQDPDDDKFLACAIAGNRHVIVSGDRELLKVSGYQDIQVLRPRIFVDTDLP